MTIKTNPSSVRSGIFRPDGTWDLIGFRFYKYPAPDGASTGCGSQTRAPIPTAPPEKPKPVERLVDRILAAKARDPGADVSALERELDELVYALHALTPEEIQIVEGAAK